MDKMEANPEQIQDVIYKIRGKQVMLDRDIASLYHVETRVINQSVRRNSKRFPEDFMFQLNKKEFNYLRSQSVISNKVRYLPIAFTEQGIAMLSSVIGNDEAAEVNVQIMRAFVNQRNLSKSADQLRGSVEKLYEDQTKIMGDFYKALARLSDEIQEENG